MRHTPSALNLNWVLGGRRGADVISGLLPPEMRHPSRIAMSDYSPEWQAYKRRRNQFWLVFAGYMPVCIAAAFVSLKLFHTLTLGFVAAFFWTGLFVFTGSRVQMWECPRCGKPFSATWWYNLSFLARRCVHCGLRKYEN